MSPRALDLLTPPPPMTVSQWADKYRVLSSKGSAEHGRWRTSRTPYLAAIMDALSDSAPYTDVVFCKGAQVGATEAGLNFVLWSIDCSPGPIMLLQPTLDMVKRLVRQKLDPAIEASPTVRSRMPPPRAKDGGNSMFLKEFAGGMMVLAGANSATSLRSASMKRVFFDEIDAYTDDLDGEGDPIDLAKARTRTFAKKKRFYSSTPTEKDASRIEAAYEETDQRRYFVPCPHCGEMQTIEWGRIQWDEDDLSKPVILVCEANGCAIEEHHKTSMLAGGEWRATAPEKSSDDLIGFHISALYSPHGWYSWTEARDDFRRAKKNPALMKSFVNTVLGESYREKGEAPKWRVLYQRSRGAPYEAGSVPAGGSLLTAGVDVQRDRLEVEVRAWGDRHESWSVEYLVFPGDTADLDSAKSPWRELDALMARAFVHESGADLRIRCVGIDSGYRTQTVYTWARGYERQRVAVMKGVETQRAIVGQVKPVDVSFRGRKIRRGMRLWPVGVSTIKSELYGWLRQEGAGEDEPNPIGWVHFPEYGEEYFKQLCAEELVARKSRTGYAKLIWEKHRERNEALDCAVYARAAATICGIDRWVTADWIAYEATLGLPARSAAEVETVTTTKATPAPARPRKRRKKGRRRRGEYWADKRR